MQLERFQLTPFHLTPDEYTIVHGSLRDPRVGVGVFLIRVLNAQIG
jgi:hypothetical protein